MAASGIIPRDCDRLVMTTTLQLPGTPPCIPCGCVRTFTAVTATIYTREVPDLQVALFIWATSSDEPWQALRWIPWRCLSE